jgi:hypothetical protein
MRAGLGACRTGRDRGVARDRANCGMHHQGYSAAFQSPVHDIRSYPYVHAPAGHGVTKGGTLQGDLSRVLPRRTWRRYSRDRCHRYVAGVCHWAGTPQGWFAPYGSKMAGAGGSDGRPRWPPGQPITSGLLVKGSVSRPLALRRRRPRILRLDKDARLICNRDVDPAGVATEPLLLPPPNVRPPHLRIRG